LLTEILSWRVVCIWFDCCRHLVFRWNFSRFPRSLQWMPE
jgi:hypothetical protein